MRWTADPQAGPTTRRILGFTAVALTGLVLTHLLDMTAYQIFNDPDYSSRALPKMFRGAGYMPLWFVIATALILIDSAKVKWLGPRAMFERGLPVLFSALLTGAITEVTKISVRRLRPPDEGWDGTYVFRPWSERTFHGGNLGMPSSHTGVAFGAMWMLVRLYPRAWPVWVTIGLGCGWQRLLDRAHFFSDIYVAAATGFIAAWIVWHLWRAKVGFVDVGSIHPGSPASPHQAIDSRESQTSEHARDKS